MRARVKSCCIATAEEAAMAIDIGADLRGFVGPMPRATNLDPAALAPLMQHVKNADQERTTR